MMRRCFAIGILASIVLAGCGGGGTSVNALRGNWNGTWVSPTTSDTGTANIVIGGDGKLGGSTFDTGAGASGVVSGTVSGSGHVSGFVRYPGLATSIDGTMFIDGAGHLRGQVNQFDGTNTIVINFDLT